jgi:outer membrane immunogenic protein
MAKNLLVGGAALILTAGTAIAADLPAKAPLYKAPIAPISDWTGFYAGGFYGTAIGQSQVRTPVGPFDTLGSVDVSKAGWTAGATIGANWQFSRNWLIGLEGDIGYLANDRSFSEWNSDPVTAGVKTSGYGTVRGRFGYVTGPSLLYATGGAAFTRVENIFGGGIVTAPTSVTTIKTGWTAGAGIETRLSQNWTRKTEYLYVDAGTTDFLSLPFDTPHVASFRNQFHLIKTGLNYKFGGPSEPLPFFSGVLLPTSHNWAGFYAGINAGGGLTTSPAPGGLGGFNVGDNDMRGGGFAGGVQAGYNVMNLFGRQNWFAGVEGDIGYLGVKASHRDWNDNFAMSQKTDWYGTLRGRVGTTTGPALLYVTGGAAFVRVENGIATTVTPAQLAQVGLTVANDVRSDTRAGWTFGGGTEVALDAGWSARLEYLYIDAGKTPRAAVLTGPGGSLAETSNFSNRFHVVRAGLNYSFNAPLVARY